MENIQPSSAGISASSLLRGNNNYFGADGVAQDKIDPLYHMVFSRPNGVPQESKLATYMSHQQGPSGSGPGATLSNQQSINKGLAALSLDGTPGKKVMGADYLPVSASAIPQSSSSPNFLNSFPNIVPGSPVPNPVQAAYSVVAGSPVPSSAVYVRGDSPGIIAPSPQRITPRQSPPVDCISPTTVQLEKHMSAVSTYQENVGGTTYFYPAATGGSTGANVPANTEVTHPSMVLPSFHVYPGTPSHLSGIGKTTGATSPVASRAASNSSSSGHLQSASQQLTTSASHYYAMDDLRLETLNRNSLVLAQPDPQLIPELPSEIDNYHELCPLEPIPPQGHKSQMISYPTSTYKATNIKTGTRYCIRRIHGFRLANAKCMTLVEMWKRLQHSNIVQLREVFTSKAFNDNSILFVYDYHPGAETLFSKHFSTPEQMNGYVDPFSADPNAPRPYSHQKNALLRQHASLLPESVIWNYIIQLTAALRVIHAAGLACRSLEPSKVLLTSKSRIRLSFCGIADVLSFDATASNPLAMMPVYQQDDLSALGRLVLALACKSLLGVQRENLQTSMDLVTRSYSTDLRNLIVYLLSNQQRGRSVTDLMPMIGARFYTQLDSVQLRCDLLENEVAKEIENGRLCRLLVKLGTVNERPELNMDPTWSETGDRYMLKLFRDYVFHQVTEDGRPWVDMAHVVNCLNKLDAGTLDKIHLMSRDEQSVLVVSYAELKHCLEQSYQDIMHAAANIKTDLA